METRKYQGSITQFIEFARVYIHYLGENLPEITAFDATIDATYLTTLGANVETAAGVMTDAVYQDQLRQKTEAVDAAMKQCQSIFKKIKYFVEQTFDSGGIRDEFGLRDYKKARAKQAKMIQFMLVLKVAVEKYSAELLANGCAQLVLDGVGQALTVLETTNQDQEVFKKRRKSATGDRIGKLNAIYDQIAKVAAVSKIVFEDDPNKLELFKLPTTTSKKTDSKDEEAPVE